MLHLLLISTPYYRRWRREYKRRLPSWSEKVTYQISKEKKKSTAERKHAEGIFLGLVDRSDEILVGTPEGVVKSRCIGRLPIESRGDAKFFKSCKFSNEIFLHLFNSYSFFKCYFAEWIY